MNSVGNDLPSDIENARELARKKNPQDKNGFGAFRINFNSGKNNQQGTTNYLPFEVYLDDKRGWKKCILMFMNLTHVGRINPLEERMKQQVQDIAFLFKADYKYTRQKKLPNGETVDVVENYGAVKDYICSAFMAHVRKYQAKKEYFKEGVKIIPNVKHTREVKQRDGKFTVEAITPGNINVGIPFAVEKGGDANAAKRDPRTKFRCKILDVQRPKMNKSKDDWPFEEAGIVRKVQTAPNQWEDKFEPLTNANVHEFIRGGSMISGFDNMSDICISSMGISLPSKIDTCMITKAVPQRAGASNFAESDFAAITNIKAPVVEDDSAPKVVNMDADALSELTQAMPPGDEFDNTSNSLAQTMDGDEFN